LLLISTNVSKDANRITELRAYKNQRSFLQANSNLADKKVKPNKFIHMIDNAFDTFDKIYQMAYLEPDLSKTEGNQKPNIVAYYLNKLPWAKIISKTILFGLIMSIGIDLSD